MEIPTLHIQVIGSAMNIMETMSATEILVRRMVCGLRHPGHLNALHAATIAYAN